MTQHSGESKDDLSVYACDGCKAWHRQLFLLAHADNCPDPAWHVTTERAARRAVSGSNRDAS